MCLFVLFRGRPRWARPPSARGSRLGRVPSPHGFIGALPALRAVLYCRLRRRGAPFIPSQGIKKVAALSALGGSVKLRRLCLKARRCRAEPPACKKGASVAALASCAPFQKRVGAAPSVAHLFSGRRFRSELRERKRQKGGVSVFLPVFARLTVRAALKTPEARANPAYYER